jgi:hypothetical protein
MSLVARLEKWSKEFDKIRWRDRDRHEYDIEAVEISDLLKEAASAIRGYHMVIDEYRRPLQA